MALRTLSGLKVVELAEFVAGPYCGKLLADMGAEVVKVEPPGKGDAARHRGSFGKSGASLETSSLFCYLSTNKKGVTLGAESPEGKEVLEGLLEKADIFIVDRSSQELRAMGLSYEQVSTNNPALIMTSITPFGLTGPYSGYKAYYLNSYHSSILGYCTPIDSPDLEREPLRIGGYIGEYACGLNAGIGTLAALYCRGVSGTGQCIEISKQETLTALHPIWAVSYANDSLVPTRLVGKAGFDAMVPCKDGYVIMVLNEEHQWQALVKLMGNPEWALDDRLKEIEYRTAHWDSVWFRILAWMKDQGKHDIYHRAEAVGCPIVPVLTVEEVLGSEQFLARQFFVETEHPVAGKLKYPRPPYLFSNMEWETDRPAPLLGQHNEEIFSRWLGYSREKIASLRRSGLA